MPSLVCHHLRFDWPNGEPVFADLDATFPDGLTGLVGRNGSGKSTLLRIMAGDLVPTAGSVSGPERIAYLPQQLVLHADRTVADVLGVLRMIAESTDITMLIVTHEMGFARDVADRVLVFDQGKIVEEGTPEAIFTDPKQDRTRTFLKAVLER